MAAPEPRDYSSLYATLNHPPSDVFLLPFSPETADENGGSPATLKTALLSGSNRTPKVFVTVTQDQRVRFCHRPTTYAAELGHATIWDGHPFVFYDDLGPGNAITTVNVPDNCFHRSGIVHVMSNATMTAAWAATAMDQSLMGPFDGTNPNATEIRTRLAMVVPPKYAQLVLSKQGRTLREFWDQVAQVILDAGDEEPCEIFLNWIRVASTKDSTGNNTSRCNDIQNCNIPLADEDLRARIWEWVQQDLPHLATGTTSMATQMLAQGERMNALISTQTLQQAAAATRVGAPKTVREAWPHGYRTIMRVCNARDESELPPIWLLLANARKNERLAVLDQCLREAANDPDSGTEVAPQPTPEIMEQIMGLRLAPLNVDHLTDGLSIFSIITMDVASITKAAQRAQAYTLLYGDGMAPTLHDMGQIVDTKPHFPTPTESVLFQITSKPRPI